MVSVNALRLFRINALYLIRRAKYTMRDSPVAAVVLAVVLALIGLVLTGIRSAEGFAAATLADAT